MGNGVQKNTEKCKLSIEIRASKISGQGTFAKKKFHNGEFIATLAGEIIKTEDFDDICAERGISLDDPLQIDDDKFLILNYTSKKINHSCNPNASIKNNSDLYACKDINVDDEITYDYSTTSGVDDPWTMKCNCNSVYCRKIIGNILSIPFQKFKDYIKEDNLPDFIKKQLYFILFSIIR